MAYSEQKGNLFRWKRFTKNKRTAHSKVPMNNDDIDLWMKRVEAASEFAVSEVFPTRRNTVPDSRVGSRAMALSEDQLHDHDDAYSEAQDLLNDWMKKKLRLDLEVGEEEEEEEGGEVAGADEVDSSPVPPFQQPAFMHYSNFHDLYSHLEQEAESSAVHGFLQELMARELVDSGTLEDLSLGTQRETRKQKDPLVSMEIRHGQVRENRRQREARRANRRREEEIRREAQRREQQDQHRRRQEANRQEKLLQQEVVRLRKEMEERRSQQLMARQMKRQDRNRAVDALQSHDQGLSESEAQLREVQDAGRLSRWETLEKRIGMLKLRCLQKQFSGWYWVVLERRMQMGKAAALCDWRRQLRAWRSWRMLVWANRTEREVQKTEEELRSENRRCQVAVESDRRRLLRRCLNDWQVWCRMERDRQELQSQQKETRRKMAALIDSASSALQKREQPSVHPGAALPHALATPPTLATPHTLATPPRLATPQALQQPKNLAVHASTSERLVAPPTQAWQVTRRHAALSLDERRHTTQMQTIADQKRLLLEQQKQIAQLQEHQRMLGLRQEEEQERGTLNKAPDPTIPQESSSTSIRYRSLRYPLQGSVPRVPVAHPMVKAMEERARQRKERRKQVDLMKMKRDEEKLAQQKTEEEERQRKVEEERRAAAERRKEERRREREAQLEKQHRLEMQQQLTTRAREFHRRTLLTMYGLLPWKRLVEQSQAHTQLAEEHHRRCVLRQGLFSWLQLAGESLAEKEACAAHLYEHILLRRSLCCWKKLKEHTVVLEDRAERFCHGQILRKTWAALLDHVTQERLAAWDREQRAEEHSERRALQGCFRAWQVLPRLQREEKEREARRDLLRRRVAEILPDFRPSPREKVWEEQSQGNVPHVTITRRQPVTALEPVTALNSPKPLTALKPVTALNSPKPFTALNSPKTCYSPEQP